MEQIRILHILHSMNRGGAENALMNYFRHIDRKKLMFDFLITDSHTVQFEDEIKSLGGKIYRVPLLTVKNPWPYAIGLIKFFKSHPEYKIVHSHTSSKSFIPLALARVMGVAVRCSHSHTSSSEGGLYGFIRNLLMPFLKITATDYLSCGDQAAVWLYGKKTFEKGKVLIFKNVIEAEKFRLNKDLRENLRSKLGIDKDTIVLGHTARFNDVKNHLFDLDILKSLQNRGVKSKLLLVGGGELEGKIKQKAAELDLSDDVIFVGIVPDVYNYEQAMDIFLLPSFYEGLPLSIVEAQVSGLPCFTTKGKVSSECSVTDLVTYLPLEIGADKWADEIIMRSHQIRRDRYDEIAKSGYDASTSAKLLEDFYIRRYNESI